MIFHHVACVRQPALDSTIQSHTICAVRKQNDSGPPARSPCSVTRFGCAIGLLCLLNVTLLLAAQSERFIPRYILYQDAQPILTALEEVLPAELKQMSPQMRAASWPHWVARRNAEIRARLIQGDEDSLVNFLLFGTSYTRQPRITANELTRFNQPRPGDSATPSPDLTARLGRLVQERVNDLIKGLAVPGKNERLLFLRRLVKQKGYNPDTASGREQLQGYLLGHIARVLNEQKGHAQALEAARLLGNPTEEFAERSTLYRTRGLSLDTTLLPNFAIEESLKAMLARKLVTAQSVRRVAIIGPGLDFTDKQEGYDFYPQQTIQPFALIDTLLRLGLARAEALQVICFDLSPRVNEHLSRARHRAQRGFGYTVQLPRDLQAQWKPEAVKYWQTFGNQIGHSIKPVPVPGNLVQLQVRAVRIRPDIVMRVTPVDLNIILQRLELSLPERFDLIIGTNIFIYYDVFEQSLALANVERMLRPGGFLFSNNALLELPHLAVRSVGYLTVVYSDRPDDGDHIVWYQRLADK